MNIQTSGVACATESLRLRQYFSIVKDICQLKSQIKHCSIFNLHFLHHHIPRVQSEIQDHVIQGLQIRDGSFHWGILIQWKQFICPVANMYPHES